MARLRRVVLSRACGTRLELLMRTVANREKLVGPKGKRYLVNEQRKGLRSNGFAPPRPENRSSPVTKSHRSWNRPSESALTIHK
jgi:hypothetical protein